MRAIPTEKRINRYLTEIEKLTVMLSHADMEKGKYIRQSIQDHCHRIAIMKQEFQFLHEA